MRTPVPSRFPPASRSLPRSADRRFLLSLASRIREFRNRRGVTRRMLSLETRISERHLAQIESGEGNVSIALLRRIATALSVTLSELFDPPLDPDKQMLVKLLERLPPARLKDILSRIQSEFVPRESQRRQRIALIGLRGAGKSTLGARLGRFMRIPFIELDAEIEKETGMPLADIFSLYGQAGYRSIEHRVLERVLRDHPSHVLSASGGIVSERDTYDLLRSSCYTVWIKALPEEHMSRVMAQGDFRAMAGNDRAMLDLRRILSAREPLYRQADAQLDTSGATAEASFAKLKLMIDSTRS